MDRGGLVGADGPTHHGAFDLSFLGLIPNMTLCAPRDGTELREMLRFMADYDDGPTAVRYPRGSSPADLPEERTHIELGKAEFLGCVGGDKPDVTLCAIGSMVGYAWEAAKLLAENGTCCAVVNGRWAKPIDAELIGHWAKKAGRLVTIEENVQRGGFGEAVLAALVDAGMDGFEATVMALPDEFIPHGSQAELHADLGLDAAGIAGSVELLVKS
jgi:1-deoxy-D-xylulose-5-phosphate synthase